MRSINCIVRYNFLWLLIAALTSLPTPAMAEGDDLRVASFNIRFAKPGHSEQKSENNWNDPSHPRRDRTIRIVREMEPDIFGVQEARAAQVADMREALPNFDFYGLGRDDGKRQGEFSGIFYRKDRFERKDAGTFWLSETPEKPGTTFYKAVKAVPRVASWVRLHDKRLGKDIFVLNAHWDHIDESARRQSALLMRERLAALADNIPTIVMGDFNSPEESPAIVSLLGGNDATGRLLTDSYRRLHPKRKAKESTYNDWNGKTHGSRIDFILHTDDFQPVAANIVRTSYDGLWPSDHYPVTATLRLNDER